MSESSKKNQKIAQFEVARKQVLKLLKNGEISKAVKTLEKMSNVKDFDVQKYVNWAQQQLDKVKGKQTKAKEGISALIEMSDGFIAKNDYQQAISILEQIPKSDRTDQARELLEEAKEFQEESEMLLFDLKNAVRNRSYNFIDENLDRYLELKPNSKFAKELWETLETYKSVPVKKRTYRFDDKGKLKPLLEDSLVPQLIKMAVGGVAILGMTLWFVTSYLNNAESGPENFRPEKVVEDEPELESESESKTVSVPVPAIEPVPEAKPKIPQQPDIRQQYPLTLKTTGNLKLGQILSGVSNAYFMKYSHDGSQLIFKKRFSGGLTGDIEIMDTQSRKTIRVLKGHKTTPTAVAFSSDDSQILTADASGEIHIWQTSDGRNVKTFETNGKSETIAKVDFSTDQSRVIGQYLDKSIAVWDVDSGKQVSIFDGAQQNVSPVIYLMNGKSVLAKNSANELEVWSIESKQVERKFKGKTTYDKSDFVVIDEAGEVVSIAKPDGQINIWDVKDGANRASIQVEKKKGVGGKLESKLYGFKHSQPIAVSPDGRFLATCIMDGRLLIWDLEIQKIAFEFQGSYGPDNTATFSHNSHSLVTSKGDKSLVFWDLNPETYLKKADAEQSRVGFQKVVEFQQADAFFWDPIGFSSDGQSLLTGHGEPTLTYQHLDFWDTKTTKKIKRISGSPVLGPLSNQLSPDGKSVLLINNGKIEIRNYDTGDVIKQFGEGSIKKANGLSFTADGKKVLVGTSDLSSSGRPEAIIWDIESEKIVGRKSVGAPKQFVSYVVASPDGRFVAAVNNPLSNTVRVWGMEPNSQISALQLIGHTASILSLEFSPDGRIVLTGCDDHKMRLFDATNGKLIRFITGHQGGVTTAVFSPDGNEVASGSRDATIRIWDTNSWKTKQTLEQHQGEIYSIIYNKDGSKIASSDYQRKIIIWSSSN